MGRGGMGGSIGGKDGGVCGSSGVAGSGGAAGSGTAGMATGGSGGAGGDQPICQPPTGAPGVWEEIAPPPDAANLHITDAFAVGPDDLFFAASVGDPAMLASPTAARILRWTQGCWTVELDIQTGATPAGFPSINGLGADDVWASAGEAIYHRDAQGWTSLVNQDWLSQIRQPPFSIAVQLYRVREAAPNDVWFAATSNILHWNGQAWTTFNFDDPDYPNVSASSGFFFRSIWIDSPTSVWVGGSIDQVGNTMEPSVIHHYDGTTWTHTPLPALGEVDAIWRAGSVLWLANPSPSFTILRFDGTTATPATIAGASSQAAMTSLFGRNATDIWAAGSDVARSDGQSWSLVPNVPAAAVSPAEENNTYVTGDANAVWLVTSGPVPHFFRMVVGP